MFGTLNGGAYQTLTSPSAVTDGKWHYVAATMSSSAGMTLYVDGKTVASNAAYTAASSYSGYWRIGYDNLNGWPGAPSDYYFTGSLRYVAAYTSALTAAQIANHYAAGQ